MEEENKENKIENVVSDEEETKKQEDKEDTSSSQEADVKSETSSDASLETPEKGTESPVEGDVQPSEEGEDDELTGIEEETEQEIVQKVTKKKKQRKKRDKRGDKAKEAPEWIEKVVQIRRVTKVVKGGKKLSFRAVVIAGNAKGQVGVGVGKAAEVIGAIQKGVSDAKKNAISVQLLKSTVPHVVLGRAGAAKVLLKPAIEGTGIIAGGAARTVLELGGVGDILAKSLGSRSPLNVARATLNGLTQLRKFDTVAALRGLSMREMLGMTEKKVKEGVS